MSCSNACGTVLGLSELPFGDSLAFCKAPKKVRNCVQNNNPDKLKTQRNARLSRKKTSEQTTNPAGLGQANCWRVCRSVFLLFFGTVSSLFGVLAWREDSLELLWDRRQTKCETVRMCCAEPTKRRLRLSKMNKALRHTWKTAPSENPTTHKMPFWKSGRPARKKWNRPLRHRPAQSAKRLSGSTSARLAQVSALFACKQMDGSILDSLIWKKQMFLGHVWQK